MTEFVASKFDADTDPDRPVLGDEITVNEIRYVIRRVHWVTSSALMKSVLNGTVDTLMAPQEYDECFNRQHETRPGVQWWIYVERVQTIGET